MTNSSEYNRTENGFVFQRMTEGFNNNPLTSKITLHTKHKGSIPDWDFRDDPLLEYFCKEGDILFWRPVYK